MIKYGLYEVIRTGRLVDNADTSTGKSHSASTIQFIRQTDRIPLKKGNYFGFQSRIEPLPDRHFIKLKKVVTHPEMTLPAGSKKTGYQVDETKKVSVGVAFTTSGYSLDEDYELVAGEWTIHTWFSGRKEGLWFSPIFFKLALDVSSDFLPVSFPLLKII